LEYKRSLYRHSYGGVNGAQGARATWGLTDDAGAEAQPKDNETRTSSALIVAGEEEQGNNEAKTDHVQEEQEALEK
jgi:hypothetical protein